MRMVRQRPRFASTVQAASTIANATATCSLGKSNTRLHHSFEGTKDIAVAMMRTPALVASSRAMRLMPTYLTAARRAEGRARAEAVLHH